MTKIKSIKLFLTILLFSLEFPCMAQIPNDSIVADFRHFIEYLEETHPDPYTNYGGKALFHRSVLATSQTLKEKNTTTAEELCWQIRSFLAPLQDGHTYINYPTQQTTSHILAPIAFRTISGGLIVRKLPVKHKNLLGSRLICIEGIPVDTLYEEISKLYPTENETGKILNLCWYAHSHTVLSKLIPTLKNDSITYQLKTPDNHNIRIKLPFMPEEEWKEWSNTQKDRTRSKIPTTNLSFSFIGKGKETMYFRSTSIMARDNIEISKEWGMDYYTDLKFTYEKTFHRPMPSDTLQAISELPSFSGEFDKMLQQMKKHHSTNLIIDLRGNGGGWTPIIRPTLYQLWGDEYLKKNMGDKLYRIISPLYIKKNGTTLSEYNAQNKTNYSFGDYVFSESKDKPQNITESYRNKFIKNSISCIKDKLTEQSGKPIYTPKHIYVLTDANTFSAAFHYAFYLWKMGATIVGTSSSQAPNTYMETTPFVLPNTKLNGSISNSLQLYLPIDDPRANQLRPDWELTYDDYKRYGFDEQAEVLYLLDKIEKQ